MNVLRGFASFNNFVGTVCVKTVDKFSSSLKEDVKKDHKKIEEEFKKYCKTTKNKENRFVCHCIAILRLTV